MDEFLRKMRSIKVRLTVLPLALLLFLLFTASVIAELPPPPPVPEMPGGDGAGPDDSASTLPPEPPPIERQYPASAGQASVGTAEGSGELQDRMVALEQKVAELGEVAELKSSSVWSSTPFLVLLAFNIVFLGLILYVFWKQGQPV